jgi:hypothetical protein
MAALAPDEMRSSGGTRSASASLLHLWKSSGASGRGWRRGCQGLGAPLAVGDGQLRVELGDLLAQAAVLGQQQPVALAQRGGAGAVRVGHARLRIGEAAAAPPFDLLAQVGLLMWGRDLSGRPGGRATPRRPPGHRRMDAHARPARHESDLRPAWSASAQCPTR